jgi:hypothetical protein
MRVHLRPSAPPGAAVKLKLDHGTAPEVGTELQTPSGRRYLLTRVGGRKTLHCVVLGPNTPVQGPVCSWEWTARNKRREP